MSDGLANLHGACELTQGWTIAVHSDGSGEPGLYHECDSDNALSWLDAVDLPRIMRFIYEHVCGEEDRLMSEV
jgi:hypothetical protein